MTTIYRIEIEKNNRVTGLISRVFTIGHGDWSSILGRIKPKTHKIILDAALHNTEYFQVRKQR